MVSSCTCRIREGTFCGQICIADRFVIKLMVEFFFLFPFFFFINELSTTSVTLVSVQSSIFDCVLYAYRFVYFLMEARGRGIFNQFERVLGILYSSQCANIPGDYGFLIYLPRRAAFYQKQSFIDCVATVFNRQNYA